MIPELTAKFNVFWPLLNALVAVNWLPLIAVEDTHVASYAPDQSRGRMVSTVMTGLLLGILLARTASGAVAGLSGD